MNKESPQTVCLTRHIQAAMLPINARVTLHAGEKARLMESSPDGYVILLNGYTYRVDPADADALGLEPGQGVRETGRENAAAAGQSPPAASEKPAEAKPAAAPSSDRSAKEVEKAVWEELKKCYDPEIPVNLVDLGLIYDVRVEPMEAGGGFRVKVRMTLTAPGCAMAPMIQQDVYNHVMSLGEVQEAEVELVWDPPWNQNMMSETARLQLGLL